MPTLRFIISRAQGKVSSRSALHAYPANCLMVGDDDAVVLDTCPHTGPAIFDFYTADLQALYPEVVDLLAADTPAVFLRHPIRLIKAEQDVINVMTSLGNLAPSAFLHFCYVYCLSLDRGYFSGLLLHSISGNRLFCDFIETHYLQPWTVSRLADELDMPLRKFNQLFLEIYGKPAKRWLLEKKLDHAKKLLASTSMRVLDIALECGFSNHAHFTGSFRQHFLCNPKQFRAKIQSKLESIF